MNENSDRRSFFSQIKPYLVVSVAPLCWAGNVVLGRGMADVIPPVGLAFWRWTIAFLILFPFAWRQAARDWPAVIRAWKIILLISFFGIACFNTMLYRAVHTIPAINAALIQSAMPAFIILISLILLRERVTAIQILGTILCMAGAAIVVLRGDLEALWALSLAEGDIIMITAVFLYAVYSVLLRWKPDVHPLSILFYIFILGVLMLLPVYIWEHHAVGPVPASPEVLITIGYVAAFPGVVAYFCWNYGVATIGPNRTGLFINLLPIFAAVLSIVWLGESPAMFHLVGMAAIFSGILLFNRRAGGRDASAVKAVKAER
jgi:drug/metabolite transporter (DMT)-like permease